MAHICDKIKYLSILFTKRRSVTVHPRCCKWQNFILLMTDIPVYMYHIFFIHSTVNRHLGCFYVLAIVNNAAVNIRVRVSFQIMIFSRYMPRSRISGSRGSSIVSLLRSFYTNNLHSGCTS